jgi:transposase-like protein
MTNTPYPLDSVLRSVAETRGKLEANAAYRARLLAESRNLCIQLFFDHGYTVTHIARLTGHQRITVRQWMDIAELEREKAGTPPAEMDPLFTDG